MKAIIRYGIFTLLVVLLNAAPVAAAVGDSAAHVANRSESKVTVEGDYYKYGLFYYNKDDKRLFPPKGNGMGWTVNFANPWSVGTFAGGLTIFLWGYYYYKKRTRGPSSNQDT